MKIRDAQREALAKSTAVAALVRDFTSDGKHAFYVAESSQVCIVGLRQEQTRLTLDDKGRIVQTLSPLGRRTSFQFDGAYLSAQQGSDGQTVHFEHADEGRQLSVFRSDGSREDLLVDERGELVRHTLADGTCLLVERGEHGMTRLVDRNGAQTSRAYDQAGNIKSIRDALGRVTRLACEEEGTISRVEYADGTLEEYSYDGDRTHQFVNGERHAEYLTSPEGRLVAAQYADGQSLSFERDDKGRVVRAVSLDATVQCEYDDAGRILSEDQDG